GPEMLGVAKVDQSIEAGHRLENDVAALAAFAAVGAAIFDIFFAPEADRSRAARTGADEHLGLIEKMHSASLRRCGGGLEPQGCHYGRAWRASYRPILPPPGSGTEVDRPQLAAIGSLQV